MKKIDRINDFITKYQASIGILTLIVGFIFTTWQLSLTRDELRLNQMQVRKELLPKWKITPTWDDENILIDKLVFSTSNSAVNFIKSKITILDKATPYSFETYDNEFNTGSLKRRLIDILTTYYDLKRGFFKGGYTDSGRDKYPIAITITYEVEGAKKDTTVLADYIFNLYYSSNKDDYELRTYGLEFQKYVSSGETEVIKELIRHNINNSFLSCCPGSIYHIQDDLIAKDSVMNSLLEYTKLNLETIHLVNDGANKDSSSSTYRYSLLIPSTYYNSDSTKRATTILNSINSHLRAGLYDEEIVKSLSMINEKGNAFEKYEGKSVEELGEKYKPKSNSPMNQEEYDEWEKANRTLMYIIYKRTPL